MIQHWIGIVIFFLLAGIGVLLTIFGIMGTFLVLLGAVLYNLITWSWTISLTTLIWMLVLALIGEGSEWIVELGHGKARGVSGMGIAGAIIGGVLGASALSAILPLIGTIIGLFLGAVAGAYVFELIQKQDAKKAWKAAKAALIGRIIIGFIKTTIAAIQIYLVVRAVF